MYACCECQPIATAALSGQLQQQEMQDTSLSFLDLSFSPLRVSPRQIDKSKKALIQAIEEGLATFGESVPEIVFQNLARKFSLDKEETIDQPDMFTKALYTMFGSGATTVEKVIAKSVCEILRTKSLSPATFCDCIDIVRSRIQQQACAPLPL